MTAHHEAVVACTELDAAIALYEDLGLRLDMIMPADAPRLAQMSGSGISLKLSVAGADEPHAVTREPPKFQIARATGGWSSGRAGMQYRDLIPGRLGGRVIASQIRIPDGGPVPDYVHYHRIVFQMIYCRRGWVRVVYEDQGPPFVMHEGDCVLQPPTIRHRVLESSAGLEVIEVSAPAEHETLRDHDLALPTPMLRAGRIYGAQRFVRHVAADAAWQIAGSFAVRDTGIAAATNGLAAARVLRAAAGATATVPPTDNARFLMVLDGRLSLGGKAIDETALATDDACVIPGNTNYSLTAATPCDVLEVALPPLTQERSVST